MQLELKNVSFRYTEKSPWILKDVNMTLNSEERVGLVGPSGYGKSTLAKILAGYEKPVEGQVLLDGKPLPEQGVCPIQLIYQHPEYAVNPRWKMKKILEECWQPEEELLHQMGIEKEWMNRWPAELSGGELQRFCIARVLGPDTKFLICDEITTMLDVITQAQIWDVVLNKSNEQKFGMLVVTHNQAIAQKVCTRIVEIEKLNQI